MKNILLSSAALLTAAAAFGQIIVTQSNMPYVGYGAIEANDTTTSLTPGSGGVNQTWNFSSLLNQGQDTMVFTNPSWIPGGSSFPSSNLGIVQFDSSMGGNFYGFATSSATALDLIGYYGDFIGTGYQAVVFQSPWRMLALPATYLTAWNSSYGFSLAFPDTTNPPVDSVMLKENVSSTNLIDGWGTITIPTTGSYPSIRQFVIDTIIDSMFVHTTFTGWQFFQRSVLVDTIYRWWSNTLNFPTAEFNSNGDGTWNVSYFLSTYTGIDEPVVSSDIIIYPNPTSGNLRITFATANPSYGGNLYEYTNYELEIYNILGEKVIRSVIPSGARNLTIDISSHPNGMYFLHLKSEEEIFVEKLIIQK